MPSLFLMVLADDLVPEDVTTALRMRPSAFWRKGEKRTFVAKSGKPISLDSTHRWGGWKRDFPSLRSESALVRKMKVVVEGMRKRKKQIRSLTDSGHEVSLVSLVSLVQDTSSIIIPPALHGLLGELEIHLRIDFWPRNEGQKRRANKPLQTTRGSAHRNSGSLLQTRAFRARV